MLREYRYLLYTAISNKTMLNREKIIRADMENHEIKKTKIH